ncbi:osmotin-like protein [Phtheirospermum japonicum]|uniref:Osmotin-like protein n=1 Tax=Phtheirospermum japonicum TaxID=374723 RepID=A0A830B510_9LAMI|nr:osmotin-like protein [Phtheirospermum japonicum]
MPISNMARNRPEPGPPSFSQWRLSPPARKNPKIPSPRGLDGTDLGPYRLQLRLDNKPQARLRNRRLWWKTGVQRAHRHASCDVSRVHIANRQAQTQFLRR